MKTTYFGINMIIIILHRINIVWMWIWWIDIKYFNMFIEWLKFIWCWWSIYKTASTSFSAWFTSFDIIIWFLNGICIYICNLSQNGSQTNRIWHHIKRQFIQRTEIFNAKSVEKDSENNNKLKDDLYVQYVVKDLKAMVIWQNIKEVSYLWKTT